MLNTTINGDFHFMITLNYNFNFKTGHLLPKLWGHGQTDLRDKFPLDSSLQGMGKVSEGKGYFNLNPSGEL